MDDLPDEWDQVIDNPEVVIEVTKPSIETLPTDFALAKSLILSIQEKYREHSKLKDEIVKLDRKYASIQPKLKAKKSEPRLKIYKDSLEEHDRQIREYENKLQSSVDDEERTLFKELLMKIRSKRKEIEGQLNSLAQKAIVTQLEKELTEVKASISNVSVHFSEADKQLKQDIRTAFFPFYNGYLNLKRDLAENYYKDQTDAETNIFYNSNMAIFDIIPKETWEAL